MQSKAEFTLRDARPEDRAAAQAITVAAYQEYAAAMPAFAWEAYRLDMWETVGNLASGEHIVAEQNGALVGSVLMLSPEKDQTSEAGVPSSDEWPEVRLLAVLPEARGQGIARSLMEACVQHAREAGSQYLTLHTADQMQVARHLYERMGFVRFPALDFSPMEGIVIKGYRLNL